MGSFRETSFFLVLLLLFAGCTSPESPEEVVPAGQNGTEPAIGSPAQENETQELPQEANESQEAPKEEPDEEGDEPTSNQELVDSVLASYDENDSSTFSNVNLLLETTTADMLPLLESNDSYEQWTGLYVLSNIAYNATPGEHEEIKEALSPFIRGNLSSFKMIAAVTLITMGDKEGIPALIDLLGSDEPMFLWEPPVLVCNHANEFLVRYTEKDFGYSCAPGQFDAEARQQWEAWWNENSEKIAWDPDSEKMVVE
jgi:HEAT repeat protein